MTILRTCRFMAALLIGVAGFSGASSAALLGIGPFASLPIVQFDQGTTVIAGGTFTSTVTNGVMAIGTAGGGSLVTDNSLVVTLQLDNACNLISGDLVLSGGIFGGATELLLTADALAFGFTEDPGNPIQQFDFRFAVTGGSLASDPGFLNQDLGVVITSLASNFVGDCSVTSAGGVKGSLGPIPPIQAAEGCTPGYWKQPHHFDSWEATPYSPTDTVASVFGPLDPSVDSLSLADALALKGGGLKALMRHAVAALLNASHPDVSYTESGVIASTQAAVASGDYEPTKDLFESANEEGCPLN